MGDWTQLPSDILEEISSRLQIYEDFLTFRGVCTAWRSATPMNSFKHKDSQMPWLMLAPRKGTNLREFYSIPKDSTLHAPLPHQVNAGLCFPTTGGWFISLWQDWSINLLHPFYRSHIKLPHIKSFNTWRSNITFNMYMSFFHKTAVSFSESVSEDFSVMAIYGSCRDLAYYRKGDKVWTTIDTPGTTYGDIIYYRNNFYGVNYRGQIMICHHSNRPREVAKMPISIFEKNRMQLYLVESGGELLVVSRLWGEDEVTHTFNVFKVDLSTNTWSSTTDLGNRSLFVGQNSSFSVEAWKNPFCLNNCIYFTDDNADTYQLRPRREGGGGGKDMGIYHIKECTITSLCNSEFSCHRISPPMWVQQCFISD